MVTFEDEPDKLEKRRVRHRFVEDEEADISTAVAEKRRIRHVEAEKDLRSPRSPSDYSPPFSRSSSPGSALSIHAAGSVWNARRGVDPAVALPIEYQTASFNITNTNTNGSQLARTKSAREEAAKGMFGFQP